MLSLLLKSTAFVLPEPLCFPAPPVCGLSSSCRCHCFFGLVFRPLIWAFLRFCLWVSSPCFCGLRHQLQVRRFYLLFFLCPGFAAVLRRILISPTAYSAIGLVSSPSSHFYFHQLAHRCYPSPFLCHPAYALWRPRAAEMVRSSS